MYTRHNWRVSIDYLKSLGQIYNRNEVGKASE